MYCTNTLHIGPMLTLLFDRETEWIFRSGRAPYENLSRALPPTLDESTTDSNVHRVIGSVHLSAVQNGDIRSASGFLARQPFLNHRQIPTADQPKENYRLFLAGLLLHSVMPQKIVLL
jgi:hypothetical protein